MNVKFCSTTKVKVNISFVQQARLALSDFPWGLREHGKLTDVKTPDSALPHVADSNYRFATLMGATIMGGNYIDTRIYSNKRSGVSSSMGILV